MGNEGRPANCRSASGVVPSGVLGGGAGYRARDHYESHFDLKYAIDRLAEGEFSREAPDRYRDVVNNLLESDHYQLLADYADYVATQDKVDDLYRRPAAWTRAAILNVAGMGAFSSDRTIREYANEIWGIQPLGQSESTSVLAG